MFLEKAGKPRRPGSSDWFHAKIAPRARGQGKVRQGRTDFADAGESRFGTLGPLGAQGLGWQNP
jgi:hypothetical protein